MCVNQAVILLALPGPRRLANPPAEDGAGSGGGGGGGDPPGLQLEAGDASSKAALEAKYAAYQAAAGSADLRMPAVEVGGRLLGTVSKAMRAHDQQTVFMCDGGLSWHAAANTKARSHHAPVHVLVALPYPHRTAQPQPHD